MKVEEGATRQQTGGWWNFCGHTLADGTCGERVWMRASDVGRIPIPRFAGPDSNQKHTHRAPAGCPPDEPLIADEPTVKRLDMFGAVTDTHQTETELNGWKPTQCKLL